jgi:hypothetical protein
MADQERPAPDPTRPVPAHPAPVTPPLACPAPTAPPVAHPAPTGYPAPTNLPAADAAPAAAQALVPRPPTDLDQAPAAAVTPTAPGEIATLPPLAAETVPVYPPSRLTGRPRRPAALAAAAALSGLAGGTAAVAYGCLWWTASTVTGLPAAARLFAWTRPDPVSVLAVALVVVTALLTALVVALFGAIAHNAWQGRRWTRWGALATLAVAAGLTYLLHPYAMAALVPAALGAGALWLPAVGRFNAAMAKPPVPARLPVDPRPVRYGPQTLLADLS